MTAMFNLIKSSVEINEMELMNVDNLVVFMKNIKTNKF